MVDMVLSHNRRGHRGKITVLSSRGLLSLQHRQVNPFPLVAEEVPFGAELPELTAWLRTLARTITSEGGDWRSAIDGLRPHTQSLWRSMSLVQRRRFLRHAHAYWDVHRHRMAPEVDTQVAALRATGRLEVIAGRIIRAELGEDGIDVEIARRGRDRVETGNFARLIDCTGLRRRSSSLRKSLASSFARKRRCPDRSTWYWS